MSGTEPGGDPGDTPIPSSGSYAIIPVSSSFGPVFICAYISLALYGLLLHQVYRYFSLYRSDPRWLRGLVIVALLLETAVSVLHIHLTYFYFVLNYGYPLAFFQDVWSLNLFSTISACIMITCQSFYATRIILVGPTKFMYLPVVVGALLMAGALGISLAITLVGFRGLSVGNFQMLLDLMLAYNAVASGGDVIHTASMTYILHSCRTGLKRTDGLINRLIMYTISTGLLTTIFNILSAILIRVLGIDNWVWLGTMMIAERLYSNSLMAALNSRKFATGAVKRGAHKHNRGRSADPFGTAVRISSTMRFDHGRGLSVTDDEFELRVSQMARRKRTEFEEGTSAAASGTTLVVERDELSKYGG
ncbi:hypothetical protein V8D89_001680 [Ganoderma adspersum]